MEQELKNKIERLEAILALTRGYLFGLAAREGVKISERDLRILDLHDKIEINIT